MSFWFLAGRSWIVRTKDYEAGVRIRGAQGILGRAAVHGAVELGRHSLQDQLLPLPLHAAVQQATPHPRPGEEGLREHLVLSTPGADGIGEREGRGGLWRIESAERLRAKDT